MAFFHTMLQYPCRFNHSSSRSVTKRVSIWSLNTSPMVRHDRYVTVSRIHSRKEVIHWLWGFLLYQNKHAPSDLCADDQVAFALWWTIIPMNLGGYSPKDTTRAAMCIAGDVRLGQDSDRQGKSKDWQVPKTNFQWAKYCAWRLSPLHPFTENPKHVVLGSVFSSLYCLLYMFKS
jgi:hypothetical protein